MKFRGKRLAVVVLDMLACVLALGLAVWLRFDGKIPEMYTPDLFFTYCGIAMVSVVAAGFVLGAYNSLWEYVGFSEMFRQFFIVMLSGFVFLLVKLLGLVEVYGSIVVMYCVILFIITAGLRSLPRYSRWWMAKRGLKGGKIRRVVVIGAGAAGDMLIKRLCTNSIDGLYPVAVIDDNQKKWGTSLSGVRVYGGIESIEAVVRQQQADEIIIAIPSAAPQDIRRICDCCQKTNKPVKIFSSVMDVQSFLAGDKKTLREVSIEDLLFRDSVEMDMQPVFDFIRDKVVLVTGGAGSIGSEICRQVLQYGCKKLIIFDIHENGLFDLNEELKAKFDPKRYKLCMGSIRDKKRLGEIFATQRPDIVLHAAAHKHVPMMELNPMEAVKNNVFGTQNVLQVCVEYQVKRFILISTDKAVRPTSVMGATKRMAELLVQKYNGNGGCEMAAVRFGNVLGSNGSVIPTFRRQIAAGGPVTVTHRDIERYFMTISEAVFLVLTAGAQSQGGEIFVLNMGKPVKIYDLARDMIRLSGLEPNKDIDIKVVGLRPGEKLYEELMLDSETVDETSHSKIFVIQGENAKFKDFLDELQHIAKVMSQEKDEKQLRQLVFQAIREQEKDETVLPPKPPGNKKRVDHSAASALL